jgi:hypothetical protein
MKYGQVAILLVLSVLGACAGARIDVKPLAAAPRPMAPRDVQSVKTFESRPDGAVAVYDIDAYGDVKPKLDVAARQKAASLGCDGVMILVRKEAIHTDNDATTGQLNEHHTRPGSHVDVLCMVLPAPASDPDAAPAAAPPSAN